MVEAKYVEGAFYWARQKWGDDLEPFIVCCEDPYGRGKFRQFDGHWGSNDAYEILSGPLICQIEPKKKWKLDELPKNDGRWEPAGWWCASEQYGQPRVPEEIKDGTFYVLNLPKYTVNVVCDELAGDHFTYLPDKMYKWCVKSLKGWWSAVNAEGGRDYLVFSNEADAMLFRLKWL